MFQYSFANVDLELTVVHGGQGSNPDKFKITGYGTGEGLINIARRAPIATTTYGAYGTMILNMQRIKSGDVAFPLLMNAKENKYLQDFANFFQEQAIKGGELITPIQGKLVDNMGKDQAKMKNGVILAMPSMVRGQTINTVTWVLTFEEVTFERNHGGDVDDL